MNTNKTNYVAPRVYIKIQLNRAVLLNTSGVVGDYNHPFSGSGENDFEEW